MSEEESNGQRLRAEASHGLMELLRVDLELGFTFVGIARTRSEIGHPATSQQAHGNAEKAASGIERLLERARDLPQSDRDWVRSRLNELKLAIEQLPK